MAQLDLEAFRQAPFTREPFNFTVVPGFIRRAEAPGALEDFPDIAYPGLLPLEATKYGPRFASLVQELTSAAMTAAVSEKFGVDLAGRPTMVTVRGRCQEKDGRIHTDSETKIITALLYFNHGWEVDGGRLRLLRKPDDLNDIIAEVPPDLGTLVVFRRSACSFHGHEPFVGVRRAVMVNWMASGLAAQRELMRHKISAQAKRMFQHA